MNTNSYNLTNEHYVLDIQVGKNQEATAFSVKTPFGKVEVLHSKEELLDFIHEQRKLILNWTPLENSGIINKGRVIQEMSHNLNAITSKVENVLTQTESLGYVAEFVNNRREGAEKSLAHYAKSLASDMASLTNKYHSKQAKELLDKHLKEPIQEHQLYLMREALQVILDLEDVNSFEDMYSLYSFPPGMDPVPVGEESKQDEVELRAGLNSFIQFAIGSRAIDLLIPESKFPMQHHVLKEFYSDESHPMDLQRFLRTESKTLTVTTVLKNLTQAMENEIIKNHDVFKGDFEHNFNPFIQKLIQARLKSEMKSLLDIETVQMQISKLRENQINYYSNKIGIENEMIQSNYTFSTPTEQKGIYLYEKGQEPEAMKIDIKTKFMKDKENNVVYLRVPDADNRVVRMSATGWKELKKIQKKNANDLIEVKNRLETLFKDEPNKRVTGRTKSTLGILDKTGRLCKLTQSNPGMLNKYSTIRDIIDINGMRIISADPSELAEVIETLKKEGFEFLELDNKYNTIRKQGDYKVIPTTVRDPVTNCVFELQLTTASSLSVSDLNHNVNYKQKAIGLPLNEDERKWVAMLSKFSAVAETLNLMGYPIPLTKEMSQESITQFSKRVEEFLGSIKY